MITPLLIIGWCIAFWVCLLLLVLRVFQLNRDHPDDPRKDE